MRTGKVYELGTPEYDYYVKERLPGSRAVIVVDVHRVGTVSTRFSVLLGSPSTFLFLTASAQHIFQHYLSSCLSLTQFMQSCGWGIPYYKFEGHRRVLLDFARSLEKKDAKFEAQEDYCLLASESDRGNGNENGNGNVEAKTEAAKAAAPGGLKGWWRKMNAQSIDGLPAVERAGYVTGKPMGGVMPDPEKAGFKQRGSLDAVVCANGDAATHGTMDVDSDKLGDRLLASIPLRLRETVNVNAQLVTGILIGFLASFVLSDLASFGWKYIATQAA